MLLCINMFMANIYCIIIMYYVKVPFRALPWTSFLRKRLSLANFRGRSEVAVQFKCTKYFRDDFITLVFEDAQCFNSISEPSSDRYENLDAINL